MDKWSYFQDEECVICTAPATGRGARVIIDHGPMCPSCAYCFFCYKRGGKWLRKVA